MQRDDALDLALREVRKRDVVAEQEAQARVVVLEVHGAAHTLRELVDEAEDAVVRAGARRVHQVALELKPKVAADGLADVHLALAAVGMAEHDVQLAVVGEELVVEHVYYFVAVYRYDRVAGVRFAMQRAAAVDGFDEIVHVPPKSRGAAKCSAPHTQKEERYYPFLLKRFYLLSSTLMTARPLY